MRFSQYFRKKDAFSVHKGDRQETDARLIDFVRDILRKLEPIIISACADGIGEFPLANHYHQFASLLAGDTCLWRQR